MRQDFRNINPVEANVILVENSDRILQTFAESLSSQALLDLTRLGAEAWLQCRVTDVQPAQVTILRHGQSVIVPCETVVWAAGVKASGLGKLLAEAAGSGVELDKGGRVNVNKDCSVVGRTDVFVIGDMADFTGTDGKQLPGVAPVAMQQGQYLAKLIDRRVRGQSAVGEFRYHDKGNMATIGRSKAVAESMGFKLSGSIAWLAWLFIHILYLARFENRVLVMSQWFWNYVTRNRTARLITGLVKV